MTIASNTLLVIAVVCFAAALIFEDRHPKLIALGLACFAASHLGSHSGG